MMKVRDIMMKKIVRVMYQVVMKMNLKNWHLMILDYMVKNMENIPK